jgi:threonine dehydrogenase-like Zn-dependent dehydrogenase
MIEGDRAIKARRVLFTGPHRAEVEEFVVPVPGGPEDVLVRNCATLISPGTELAVFTDNWDVPIRAAKPYPLCTGYAAVGEVLDIGDQVKGLKPGDRVFTPTGHASAVIFNAGKDSFVKLPEMLSASQAVFCRMAVVGMSTLTSSKARPGDGVAIGGLGLVGNLTAQVFQLSQMRVIAIEPSAFRRQRAAACGLNHLFVPTDPTLKEQIQEIIGPVGWAAPSVWTAPAKLRLFSI